MALLAAFADELEKTAARAQGKRVPSLQRKPTAAMPFPKDPSKGG